MSINENEKFKQLVKEALKEELKPKAQDQPAFKRWFEGIIIGLLSAALFALLVSYIA